MNPTHINQTFFDDLSEAALCFYREHGYAVLNKRFHRNEIDGLQQELNRMMSRYADEMNMSPQQYQRNINQWRDLWKKEDAYTRLLNDERLHKAASFFMEEEGVQLLHDHIISKPCKKKENGGTNATLPWHQDYPFWPVNTPHSLSLWIPFEDVAENGACMEVVDGSHKWGASEPVDFIMDDPERFRERDDVQLTRLPARSGMTVVLHSLTWHRSHPNEVTATTRPAYITLWIPSHARYTPDEKNGIR